VSWPAFPSDKYLDARRPEWFDHELNGNVRHEGGRVRVHPAAGEIIELLAGGGTLLTQ
jgi:hypothetical protein